MKQALLTMVGVLCLVLPGMAQQKDTRGCTDHPLFTRMPDCWIYNCSEKDFDAYTFKVGQGKTESVEGHYWKITYYPQASAKSRASELQILRNFENAVAKLGGTSLSREKSRETFHVKKDGKEFWVELWAEFTGKYGFTIIQKGAMTQDIEANADVFMNDLRNTGHTAVYGIYFDTGKADLKPESEKAVAEIAKLLKNDAGLRLFVVGHTDNVGGVESNMKLSQDRADAVIQSLMHSHGVAAPRLKAFGNGPFAPVASNDTEEGKAKNRRVELVKQ